MDSLQNLFSAPSSDALQDLILPNGPLIIVDKRWQRSRQNAAADSLASTVGHKRPRSDEPDDCMNDIKITVMKRPWGSDLLTDGNTELNELKTQQTIYRQQARRFEFVNSSESSREKGQVAKLVRSHVRKGLEYGPFAQGTTGRSHADATLAECDSTILAERKLATQTGRQNYVFPRLGFVCPSGSSSPYYGGLSFTVKPSFHNLANHCMFYVASKGTPMASY